VLVVKRKDRDREGEKKRRRMREEDMGKLVILHMSENNKGIKVNLHYIY